MEPTRHGTLVAATVKTETLPPNIRGFRVTNRGEEGAAVIWWTVGRNDATTPAVAGAGSYYLPPVEQDEEEDVAERFKRLERATNRWTSTVFKLIASDAVDYSVETW